MRGNMKNVLVLGAGLVAKPLVEYLLNKGFYLTIATRSVEKAEKILKDHPKAKAVQWRAEEIEQLEKLIKDCDLAVSLLPAIHHVQVAELCIKHKKHMVTTSYVSPQMHRLNESAIKNGIMILNEIGLDPGIDHMSAMKIIHCVEKKGGFISSFRSYCGGLPAPEANTNPWGYKFSWSPRGVVLAARNNARYLLDGMEVNVNSEKLFEDFHILNVEGLGDFECYPNRDSLGYIEIYGLKNVKTMFRGTLRNIGWCRLWQRIGKIGLLSLNEIENIKGITYRNFLSNLINCPDEKNLESFLAKYIKEEENSDVMKKLDYIGLLSDEKITFEKSTPLDVFADLLLKKLCFKEGERDMIVLVHKFIGEYPHSKKKESITSSLIDFGIPNGDSAMSRTVSLPAAIAVRLILEGKIYIPGVLIPVQPEIYEPVLNELISVGISMKEKYEEI